MNPRIASALAAQPKAPTRTRSLLPSLAPPKPVKVSWHGPRGGKRTAIIPAAKVARVLRRGAKPSPVEKRSSSMRQQSVAAKASRSQRRGRDQWKPIGSIPRMPPQATETYLPGQEPGPWHFIRVPTSAEVRAADKRLARARRTWLEAADIIIPADHLAADMRRASKTYLKPKTPKWAPTH